MAKGIEIEDVLFPLITIVDCHSYFGGLKPTSQLQSLCYYNTQDVMASCMIII